MKEENLQKIPQVPTKMTFITNTKPFVSEIGHGMNLGQFSVSEPLIGQYK